MRSFAVVPAAGRSRRMGRAKLLLPWGRATVIESILDAWQKSRVERVVVTVGPEDDRLASLCRSAGAEVVRAEAAPPEMKDSVLLALRHIGATWSPNEDDAWLLAPADSVGLSSRVIDLVIDEFAKCQVASDPTVDKAATIVVPRVGERRGHPVAFAWGLAAEVERLGDDEGINALPRRHDAHELDLRAALGDEAERVLVDLDTPEDYERLREQIAGND